MQGHFHLHDAGHHDHSHDDDHSANHSLVFRKGLPPEEARSASRKALRLALVLTLCFAGVEAVAGVMTGSLALLSDAGHMVTDSASLLLALLSAVFGNRPADARHSYGHGRTEVIAALVNSLIMLALILYIAVEAVARLLHPEPVNGAGVMVVAVLGLLVNVLAAWILSRGAHTLNSRAALLHVMGDLLGSVAAILAGAIIYATGWTAADPILSMGVCLLILRSTWHLLRQSLLVLMEGVPEHLDYYAIGRALAEVEGVVSVHDLHVWAMSSDHVALSAHLQVGTPEAWPRILAACQALLSRRFAIDHVTLQAEWPLARTADAAATVPVISPDQSA
ncbi:cation diffusion facilitator family transporter [Gulbenkiania mobilis]|uniref:Cobalt-zinc-cadmium efflux system protein n=1 Tax=Gulbenkiania mobilis TaxID=397457 RepID=A0ABY2CUD4_GULMO|nr:cation diffusion facilitator family transporter [Gulbenkiania mobilis]TCW29617.1 cobalt-zinc-cadmium efflux system protein [Gulbenkiania mobilis]